MKYFDLTLPDKGTKIYKIDNVEFKDALVDFPRPLAERMVELGYGKWVPVTALGGIPVPQSLIYPEQLFIVATQTRGVKACHVNALVDGPVPGNLVHWAHNIKEDINFQHDPKDLMEEVYTEEEILEDELLDLVEAQDLQEKPVVEKYVPAIEDQVNPDAYDMKCTDPDDEKIEALLDSAEDYSVDTVEEDTKEEDKSAPKKKENILPPPEGENAGSEK